MPSHSIADSYDWRNASSDSVDTGGAAGHELNDGRRTSPPSPVASRPTYGSRSLEASTASVRFRHSNTINERSSLLGNDALQREYSTAPDTPRPFGHRQQHHDTPGGYRAPRRSRSFTMRLVNTLSEEQQRQARESGLASSKPSIWNDERVWYDQFTSTDWVHDSIADAHRVKALRSRRDFRGRVLAWFDGVQGWVLVAIIGMVTALIAYFVNATEHSLFDYKYGYCTSKWYFNRRTCCSGATLCDEWSPWSQVIKSTAAGDGTVEFVIFLFAVMLFATASCLLTLLTKTVIPSAVSLSTLDENLAADRIGQSGDDHKDDLTIEERAHQISTRPPLVYYSAAGSGVAEIKVLVSGFVLHGYLGLKTLTIKTLALTLSVASGMSLGKEGPYVHIATCVGNIACRMFSKYQYNDGKRREVLSASSAAGVAVAFGAPIGGVLFSLEEVSYYFPPKTLFRTFFCCIVAALSLKALDPYGTGKIVLFEVRYLTDWKFFEIFAFILTGIIGGALGALFIKASRFWAKTFRRLAIIKKYPLVEVLLVAFITGVVSYWNRYTMLPVADLLYEVASPCDTFTDTGSSLCPTLERIPAVIWSLTIAFVIKAFLTVITFGIKVPAGIYVPSMVVGGILGRIIGLIVQTLALNYAHTGLFGRCSADGDPESCVVPGVYAMVAAGATMCGVTRLSVTLAVILFELTGSLDHVLPFALAILVAKWTADAIEPLSIYDLLTDMNSYPFLDNKVRPVFTATLRDVVPPLQESRIIDISSSPLVPAVELRQKLDAVQMTGELDGGLPILHNGVLVGLIPAPDLEFALDKLDGKEEDCLCLMNPQVMWAQGQDGGLNPGPDDEERSDFTTYVDPSPVSLDIHSPMDLVYECFVKLGLRYICVLRNGHFAGLVHKKKFVKYTKEVEAGLHG